MSTPFENIISGVWPGRFVWADDTCCAFSTIEPIAPGHTLLVPRVAYAKWTDAPEDVALHLMRVARIIGLAQEKAFDVPRSGLMIAGFEVPHTHLHVIPMRSEEDIRFANAKPGVDEEMDASMTAIRQELQNEGWGEFVPKDLRSAEL